MFIGRSHIVSILVPTVEPSRTRGILHLPILEDGVGFLLDDVLDAVLNHDLVLDLEDVLDLVVVLVLEDVPVLGGVPVLVAVLVLEDVHEDVLEDVLEDGASSKMSRPRRCS